MTKINYLLEEARIGATYSEWRHLVDTGDAHGKTGVAEFSILGTEDRISRQAGDKWEEIHGGFIRYRIGTSPRDHRHFGLRDSEINIVVNPEIMLYGSYCRSSIVG
jgi:hypothetical protein